MNETHGWTFVPTTEERQTPLPDRVDDSDDLAPARGALIGVIFGALCWMAIGLLIAAVRSR